MVLRDHQLYVTIGDLNKPNSIMQNYKYGKKSSYASVILRIDPVSGMPSAGNPFSNNRLVDDNDAEIAALNYTYSYGIRNSFGLGFDPITGYLWDTENGEDKYDEINLVKPGFNSGWDKVMGSLSLNNNNSVTKLLSLNGSYHLIQSSRGVYQLVSLPLNFSILQSLVRNMKITFLLEISIMAIFTISK